MDTMMMFCDYLLS